VSAEEARAAYREFRRDVADLQRRVKPVRGLTSELRSERLLALNLIDGVVDACADPPMAAWTADRRERQRRSA
jgi:hypothetical protein